VNVVLDISTLGINPGHLQTRTGVFRVVESLATGLSASSECRLRLCATHSFEQLNRVLSYLKEKPQLADKPFILPEAVKVKNLALRLSDGIGRISLSERVAFSSRVARKLFFHNLMYIERNHHYFGPGQFPDNGIFHSPFFSLPNHSRIPATLKRFLTIYDIIPIMAPQYFNYDNNHFLHHILKSLTPDDWVICISEATKKDVCNYLNLDPMRVFVAQPAASASLFHPVQDPEKLQRVRERYGIPEAPYILSLNTLEPRKNIEHSVRCFIRAVHEGKLNDLCFVLVGPNGWDYHGILNAMCDEPDLQERIILTGYVDDEDLAALYSGALGFVYMSLYEGFGLPPLEAMQCGVPVITSNSSSLPEVVGDAGIKLDPMDAEGLCQSILDLCGDSSLRNSLSAKSLQRAKLFSWDKCVQQTIGAYRVALGN
jgi:glycosyltransferase involved in cell wall biosynthesis